jgi:hypothetical protein
VYDEGCVLHGDKRTYLDLAAVQKLTGGDERTAVELLDELTAADITYRGFVLLCVVCKHAEWYSLAELSDRFRCKRCGREQVIRRQNWKHPAAPQVFYKLDEIVYQFLKSDGDVVALTLDYVSRHSKYAVSYSPEIQLRNDKQGLVGEIDICAVWDGMLTIGEAKRRGELGSSEAEIRDILRKYDRLADLLHARRVLFSTTSSEWKSGAMDTARRFFQGKLATPMFLTGMEILDVA